MAYERLNLKTGQVITEEVFAHLEDGIEGAATKEELNTLEGKAATKEELSQAVIIDISELSIDEEGYVSNPSIDSFNLINPSIQRKIIEGKITSVLIRDFLGSGYDYLLSIALAEVDAANGKVVRIQTPLLQESGYSPASIYSSALIEYSEERQQWKVLMEEM